MSRHPKGTFKASPQPSPRQLTQPSAPEKHLLLGTYLAPALMTVAFPQRRQRRCQRPGVSVAHQLCGRWDILLQESIALGTLEDHVRSSQHLPQAPGTCQVPAQCHLAGDVQAGAKLPLPRGQQRDLRQRMKMSIRSTKYPNNPAVQGWRMPALPSSCPAKICTIAAQRARSINPLSTFPPCQKSLS